MKAPGPGGLGVPGRVLLIPKGGPRRCTERQKKVQLVLLKKKEERKTESKNGGLERGSKGGSGSLEKSPKESYRRPSKRGPKWSPGGPEKLKRGKRKGRRNQRIGALKKASGG
jgi:hypothetical protein